MKKIVSFIMAVLIFGGIFNDCLYATNDNFLYNDKSRVSIENYQNRIIKNIAKTKNKMLNANEYEKLIKKLEYDNDIKSFEREMSKYEIDISRDVKSNDYMLYRSPKIGDKRITEKAYYIYRQKATSDFKVKDDVKVNAVDLILGFGSLIPKISIGLTVVSILKTILTPTETPKSQGYKNIYISTEYDQVIYTKYLEIYMDDHHWVPKAMTQKRESDGYYIISGYNTKNRKHFSNTVEYGRIRTDVGKYYYDDRKILSLADYSSIVFVKYDYLSGKTYYR